MYLEKLYYFCRQKATTTKTKTKTKMKSAIHWARVGQELQRFFRNKYIIIGIGFAIVFLFVGQQSIIQDIQRAHQIRQAETQLAEIKSNTEAAENTLKILSTKDSLERFAREQYFMHADNEDVYVVN